MMGYLNAESPFDDDGWYNTKDIVDEQDGFYRVTGRTSEVVNVGGVNLWLQRLNESRCNSKV